MIKIQKINEYIYRNVNNIWIMLLYRWNLCIFEKEYKDFLEFIYSLWFSLSVNILFRNWRKEYILEIYKWKKWRYNNPLNYDANEIENNVQILKQNLNKILSFPFVKGKVKIIENFCFFKNKIEVLKNLDNKIDKKDKELVRKFVQHKFDAFFQSKEDILNLDNMYVDYIDFQVDKFDGEELYWKNIIVNGDVFLWYQLFINNKEYKDIDTNKIRRYGEINLIEFIEKLSELEKKDYIKSIYLKFYHNKNDLAEAKYVINKEKWLYKVGADIYSFWDSLTISDWTIHLFILWNDYNSIINDLNQIFDKFFLEKRMYRNIDNNLIYLQDWVFFDDIEQYTSIYEQKKIFSIMKMYRNDWNNEIYWWKEYFSDNDIRWTPHILVPKNEQGVFENAFHGIIVGDTWSWKSYYAYHLSKNIANKEQTQVIYLDPLSFEKSYLQKEVWKWKGEYIIDNKNRVFYVWKWKWTHIKTINYKRFKLFEDEINFIWKIKNDKTELELKARILYNIIIWDTKLDNNTKEFLLSKIIEYFKRNIWKYFKYNEFEKFYKEEIKKVEDKLLYETISSKLLLSDSERKILNLENDLFEQYWKEKYILFDIKTFFDTKNYLMIETICNILAYFAKWNTNIYKYIFIDEIWATISNIDNLEIKNRIINSLNNLLRAVRQYNWLIYLISQKYEDFTNNNLLIWTNLKIFLDNQSVEAYQNTIKDKIKENYCEIYKNLNEKHKALIINDINKEYYIVKTEMKKIK